MKKNYNIQYFHQRIHSNKIVEINSFNLEYDNFLHCSLIRVLTQRSYLYNKIIV